MAIGLCKTYSKEMSNKRQAKNRSAEFYTYIKAIDARTNELVGVFMISIILYIIIISYVGFECEKNVLEI